MKMSPDKRAELERIHGLLTQHKRNLQAIDQVAMLLYQKRYPLDQALLAYESYLSDQPRSPNAAYNYAWYLGRDRQFEAAVQMYRRALELGIGLPEEVHLNIGNIYMDHLGDNEKAREEFRQALELNPAYYGAHYNLGNLAEQDGDREQAAACFRKCLEIEPDNHTALARQADAHKFQAHDDSLLGRMLEVAGHSENSDLHFALGSAFNQLADYDSAWKHFSRANAIERNTMPAYQAEQTEALFSRIRSQCGHEWSSRISGESHQPVFICGMFRSGSTLLEQILAAHPKLTAGGESEFFPRLVQREFHDYPDGLEEVTESELQSWREEHKKYSDRLTGGSGRLTDKRPDNFQYIGLIKAVLPSAKFVVTDRDWRDIALSIYSMRLGAAQNYSLDLADIQDYIDRQEQLVDHWKSLLADDLVRVRYEELVTRPRETVGALLEFLGEEWDERCLAFNKTGGTVKTGSVWQVREPIHARSIGRWKRYRPYFEQVFGPGVLD